MVGFLLILPDREWFVIILSCQTHNNTKWRHLLKEVIVNYMQIQALLALINTETQLLHSWYNTAESNPVDFTFLCELSIYFDLKHFFLLEKENAFLVLYLYSLGRCVLSYANLVTFVQSINLYYLNRFVFLSGCKFKVVNPSDRKTFYFVLNRLKWVGSYLITITWTFFSKWASLL